jgi:hypothetical protein
VSASNAVEAEDIASKQTPALGLCVDRLRPPGQSGHCGMRAISRNSCTHVAGLLVHPAEGKHAMPLNRNDNYRMKAIACEQQAGDASDPTSKTGSGRIGDGMAHDGEFGPVRKK